MRVSARPWNSGDGQVALAKEVFNQMDSQPLAHDVASVHQGALNGFIGPPQAIRMLVLHLSRVRLGHLFLGLQ